VQPGSGDKGRHRSIQVIKRRVQLKHNGQDHRAVRAQIERIFDSGGSTCPAQATAESKTAQSGSSGLMASIEGPDSEAD